MFLFLIPMQRNLHFFFPFFIDLVLIRLMGRRRLCGRREDEEEEEKDDRQPGRQGGSTVFFFL